MARALLFDLYGLFIPLQTRAGYESIAHALRVSPEDLWAPYRSAFRHEYDAGASSEQFWHNVLGQLGIDSLDELDGLPLWQIAVRADIESYPGRIEPMIDYVRELRARGVTCALLSNIPTAFIEHNDREHPWVRELFSPCLLSAEIGLAKPTPQSFARALAGLSLEVGEPLRECDVLFVDDTRSNTDAAAALGFAVHHFGGGDGYEGTQGVDIPSALAALRQAVDDHLAQS